MSIQITYDGSNSYVTNRPYADIFCHGIGGRTARPLHLSALIDTGADYLELSPVVASLLGMNLAIYPSHPIITAAGVTSVSVVNNFAVEIEGKLVRVTAHFLPLSTALLGLRAILAAVDFGLDTGKWLYKK